MNKCIYCGSGKNITKEHIVPKSIFSGYKGKKRLITLPSCYDCNSFFSKDEEIFVHQLHFVEGIEKKEILEKIQRRFLNPKLTRKNKELRDTFSYDENNEGDLRFITSIDDKIFKNCISKIVKGLYFYNFNKDLTFFDSEFILQRKNNLNLDKRQLISKELFIDKFDWSSLILGEKYDGYFEYYYSNIDGVVIYKLIFYEDIEIYCIFFN
ncbi:MAG: hypothetical protein PHI37_00930 [Candidatus Gracilibacteria bacterium]|nr:hypothetical protein [Candidatus Gracilibacteria bacterium]